MRQQTPALRTARAEIQKLESELWAYRHFANLLVNGAERGRRSRRGRAATRSSSRSPHRQRLRRPRQARGQLEQPRRRHRPRTT